MTGDGLELRLLAAAALSLLAAIALDRKSEQGGLLPPGLRRPWRRAAAFALLWGFFYTATFTPAVTFDLAPEFDPSAVRTGQLFVINLLLAGVLAVWYLLGYWRVEGVSTERAARGWLHAFGLHTRRLREDLRLGLVAGLAAWMFVLGAAVVLGVVLQVLGGESLAGGEQPVEIIVWMASLPVALRLAISASAGFFEELFFRGFLQPRVGIALSTLLFVLGHLSYGEPAMLFGITLLSLIYALLVRWRGNIWPAIVAHTLFDAIQLLIVIPAALEVAVTPTARGWPAG